MPDMWIAPERRRRGRWIVPGFAALVGVAIGAAVALRGHPRTGLAACAVLVGYAAMLAYRRRERVFPLHEAYGRGKRAEVHMRAAAMTGDVLVGVIVAAVLVQALRGAQIGILAGLAAVAGVTYLLSILIADRTY
jgi:hypothetical protein